MKRLDRYFLKEALVPLFFGLLIYSVLAVISVTLPRLQWIVGTPLGALTRWLVLQLPAALVQTLPIALVLAVLLAFGRLANSNELQAVQAGGVSLARSARVFALIGVVLTALALMMNEYVLPVTNARVGALYWELTGGRSGLWRLAEQNIPLDGYTLHFARSNAEDELLDVRLEAWQGKELTVVFADKARFSDEGLALSGYQVDSLDLNVLNQEALSAEEAVTALVKRHSAAPNAEQILTIKTSTTSDNVDDLITRYSGGGFEDSRSLTEAYQDGGNMDLSERERRQSAVLFQRKLAEPFANLILLLLAVPLSLLYAGSRSVAFGLSLVVTLGWYILFTLGQLFAQAGTVPIWLGSWAANILLGVLGLYLLLFRTRLR